MLHPCGHAGCKTLTMGELCAAHEPPVTKTFLRGRPYPPLPRTVVRDGVRAAA
jgi:hypothetical protein